jgi:hypothetical protein
MKSRRRIAAGVFAVSAWLPGLLAAQDMGPLAPPPACIPGQEMFADVPASSPFCPWVEQVSRDHITGGCGPQLFCPGAPLTRGQMAVFLQLAMRGTDTWIVNADRLDGLDSTDFVRGVGAGTGLTGGGTGGNLTLGLGATYQLPQACGGGQLAQWTGSVWTCANPGTGTVTSVGAGAGLTGGPITTSGTLAIAPGGITSAMIADGTVAGADVADGSIGAIDVAPAQVQLRVAAPCAPGQFIRAVNADGTVVCAADGNSGGTVTSVAAGAGLTGGPITGSGSLGVATGGITGAMIADGTIGAADVASAQVQLRVSQTCAPAGFLQAVNANGTVTCGAQSGHDHFGQTWMGGAAFPARGLFIHNTLGDGIFGSTGTTSGVGVFGNAEAPTGTTSGVFGSVFSSSGTGVRGSASATTGTTFGVAGTSDSSAGTGVRGWALSSSGQTTGVYGKSESVSGTGVRGEATSLFGGTDPSYGVVGINHRELGAGVRGEAPSRGLEGIATDTLTTVAGVHGTAINGKGVQGTATGATVTSYGVHGTAASTAGVGVLGVATSATGLTYGVRGEAASPSGWAGFFVGRVRVSNDLTVIGDLSVLGTKNFKIDHPLDPANRYLVHAAVESSEVLNLYSGTVVLDGAGSAIVTLPAWFEALNRDFRYQLTCIGGYAPVFVASEIQDGRFAIAGGRAGLKVSWQVVATRSDPHMLANPMAVEEDKPADERGTYLDPEAHGQPAERGRKTGSVRGR